MKRCGPLFLPFLLLCFTGCQDDQLTLLEPEVRPPVEQATSPSLEPQELADQWIVLFRPGIADPPGLARRMVAQAGGELRFVYQHTIQGFAARIPAQAMEGIRNNPNVSRVEPDIMVSLAAPEYPVMSPAASWGLDRIDHHELSLDGYYTYNTEGAGVHVYIIDTGIRTTHHDFEGRAFKSAEADFLGGTGDDCHGHGTHVAGTVGGATYGVAKSVTLHAVRVLDCEGSGAISGVIAGVDWVTAEHQRTGWPSVANMSLSAWDPWGFYQSLNDAVAASVEAGVVHAVAASNDNDDACDYIPASEPQALTVGATSSDDVRAYFSNFGYCLDLFAPGVGITSAFNTGDDATKTWSGTSMASPHVAGVAALYLGFDPAASPTSVKYHILTKATVGVVGDPGPNSANKLLYSQITVGEEPPPDPPDPPIAPSDLVATPVSAHQIDLEWSDNSTDESGFRIEWSTGGSPFALLTTVGADATTFSDTDLTASTTYSYRVQAFNSGGSSGYTDVAEATTGEETSPPPAGGVAAVQLMADTEITPAGKFLYGEAGVWVTDKDDFLLPLGGVTVTGDWWWSTGTAPFRTGSAVTDSDGLYPGLALVESGKVKAVSGATLHFCVTSLAHPDYEDGTDYPMCNGEFVPPSPGDPPPDPGDPLPPSDLTAIWSTRGGGRVELSWTPGGGAEVDIYRFESLVSTLIATTADNGRFNDREGTQDSTYQVCMLGAEPQDTSKCTLEKPVN